MPLHQIINLSHLFSERRDANAEMAKLPLDRGIKLRDYVLGNSELHLAALKGQAHLVPILVKRGADVNAKNDFGRTDGIRLLHCGTHATSGEVSQLDEYRKQIDFLKPLGPVDFAILPISGRHLTVAYEPFLCLIDQLPPSAFYRAAEALASEELGKCTEVLQARGVTVDAPEGGLALGRCFHFGRRRPR